MRLLEGDKLATMECLILVGSDKQTPLATTPSRAPMVLEYTSTQLESSKTNLKVFSKHVKEYMAEQDE